VSRFGARKLDDTPHRFAIGGRTVESYFSPSDGTNSHILSTLDAAQHSIAFEQLTITRTDLSAKLIAKHQAGLAVRGDLDDDTDTGTQFATLQSAGVDVHLKSGVSGLLHHKYLIVDAESPHWNGVTLTGSHNWSSSANDQNNENTLIVHDPDVANQYLQEFAARYAQFGGADTIRVGVEQIDTRPGMVALGQNFPNPFRNATQIDYALPRAEQVTLAIFDVQGRLVQALVHQRQIAGHYRVTVAPRGLQSGTYFYRLAVGREVLQRKLLLVK
jgi:phosphatidylserine/phosphatidylglycerophosphate/cardiolipin synthase-like enzyme